MKDTNYFTVQSWMVTKLKLKGVVRDVFAIIHGFTQDDESECKCSYTYMSEITGYSKRAVIDAIETLLDLSYITKIPSRSIHDMRNIYKCNYSYIDEILASEPTSPPPSEPTSPPPSELSSLHNINNNINPIESTVAGAHAKNRSFRNKQEKLTDDLSSGKDIDEQTKEKKKVSEEEKAYKKIDKTSYSLEEKDMLKQFFSKSFHSTSDRRMRKANDLDSRLKKLAEYIEAGQDSYKLIKQSLDNGYHSIWPLNATKSNNREELSNVIKVNTQEGVQKQIEYLRTSGKELF